MKREELYSIKLKAAQEELKIALRQANSANKYVARLQRLINNLKEKVKILQRDFRLFLIKPNKEKPVKALSWRALNDVLNTLDEAEVFQLLEQERKQDKRLSILQRLHQRYNTLRVARERIELLQEARNP